MKKHFEAKKPIAVLFVNGQFGERKIIIPFQTEKKIIEALKEPFYVVDKDSFYLAERIIPSAIRGQAPISQGVGGIYTNTVMIRSQTVGEISIIHDEDEGYNSFAVAYEELLKKDDEKAKEKEEK